jgi:hypothetical protein
MFDAALYDANKITLTLKMSEFSIAYAATSDCFNGDRAQITKHLLAGSGAK